MGVAFDCQTLDVATKAFLTGTFCPTNANLRKIVVYVGHGSFMTISITRISLPTILACCTIKSVVSTVRIWANEIIVACMYPHSHLLLLHVLPLPLRVCQYLKYLIYLLHLFSYILTQARFFLWFRISQSAAAYVSHYVQEYSSYIGASRLMRMQTSDPALDVPDRHYLLRNTDVGLCFKRWLTCGGRGLPVSRFPVFKVDCTFVHC